MLMKRKIYFILWISILSVCSGACSDNEDEPINISSQLQVYGLQYPLSSGVIWKNNANILTTNEAYVYYDTYTDANGQTITDEVVGFTSSQGRTETGNFILSLYESGLVFNPILASVEGKGACICFHLASSQTDRLAPGKYVYGRDRQAGTFIAYSSVLYDTHANVTPAEISTGEIVIEENDNSYHITFKGQNSNGAELTGQYDGPLQESRVKQQISAVYQDIAIAGLLDSVSTITKIYGNEYPPEYSLDFNNGKAFFSTSTGAVRYANENGKENIDLALLWDKHTQSFLFESPIRMRSWLGHTDSYNFPCHTIYMRAPATFTDTDFEKLEETGFSFNIQEEKVEFNTLGFQSGYVFFQTGNGMQGVIHVKQFTPMGTKVEDFMGMGLIFYTTPLNPTLIMDIKCPANFTTPKIR